MAREALKEGLTDCWFTLADINRIAGACRMKNVMKPYLESLTA